MNDAVVIGSGPNGLSGAIVLAQAGLRVTVFEANATIGGGARSAELTLPGFVHDVCSAVHPFAVASPFWRTLPLAEHGLQWIEPDAMLAHPFDDGSAAVIERSLDATAASLGADETAYRRTAATSWPRRGWIRSTRCLPRAWCCAICRRSRCCGSPATRFRPATAARSSGIATAWACSRWTGRSRSRFRGPLTVAVAPEPCTS